MIPIHPELLVSDGRTRSVFTCKINNIFQDYATTYRTSYIKFKVNDDSYLIRLFLQLNENTYGRIDVIISKKPIEETTEGKLLKEMGVDGYRITYLFLDHAIAEGTLNSLLTKRGRTIKLFDHFTESFLLNHKVIELLAESSEYICAFQPTDSNG
ncbi:unnamed protein product [Rhizophagus irregularis]|uniref:Uncharacterized protein n=1 Tax=Rhizophagus irregularis TaxID=588596 RepID=A0A915ZLX3_9GLOM|nr:unnamed protein product [Rhizophagus irregularis]